MMLPVRWAPCAAPSSLRLSSTSVPVSRKLEAKWLHESACMSELSAWLQDPRLLMHKRCYTP